MKVTSCRTISSWQDFTDALDSPDAAGNVVNFCPFDITHDGDETDGYDVTTDFLRVSCDKKTGTAGDAIEQVLSNGGRRTTSYELGPISKEDPPKCIIRGSARHLNVNSKGFTMIGFDFYDSEHTAVLIGDDATQANLLHCAFVDNVTQGSGGAITVAPSASKTTIFHCEFTSNEAMEGGGAIEHGEGADLTVYRSYFHLNHATSDGAALSSATALTLSRSEFFSNTVESAKGPAIYDSDSTACDAGENIACLNSDVTTGEECNGFYSVTSDDAAAAGSGSCHVFNGSCQVPSSVPTATPIVSPTAAPTGTPTASPTISHVPTPYPTRSPTVAPTASPSHSPSCVPSVSPTVGKISVPIQIGDPNPPVPVPVPAPPTNTSSGKGSSSSSGKGGGTRAPTHASHKHGHTHNSHNGGKGGGSQHNHTHNSHESHKHHHMSHTHPLHEGSNHKSKTHTHTSAGKGGSTDAAHVVGHVGSKHTHENHTHGSKKVEDAAAAGGGGVNEPVSVSNDTNRRGRRLNNRAAASSKTHYQRDLEEEDVPHTHRNHANSGHKHNHSHKSAGKGSGDGGGGGVGVPGAGTDKCAPGPPLPPLPDRKLDDAAHAYGGSLRKRRNLHW